MFTSKLYLQKVWCKTKTVPYITGQKTVGFRAVALIAAIDLEGRVEEFDLHHSSVRQEQFIAFLERLKRKDERTYIFLDNLTVHRTNKVKVYAQENNIELIFNSPYSSPYNPIERLFAYCKHNFRRLLLPNTEAKTQELITKLVRQSVQLVNSEPMKAHVNKCLQQMEDVVYQHQDL